MHAQRWSCYCGVATGKTGRQSFITQSVACGNDDLDTAAATKYRDPKTMRVRNGMLTEAVGGIGLALKRTREQGRCWNCRNYSSAGIGD